MKIFNSIILILISILSIYTLNRVETSNREVRSTLIDLQLNQYLIQRYVGEVDNLFKVIDSLGDRLAQIENKLDKTDKDKNIKRASKLNQYSSKQLPSELIKDGDWIEFCGTKYNPEPSQCYGNPLKTATGKSVYDLINDPYHLGIAITKLGLQYGFKMHDTIDIQYMDVNGEWHDLRTADGKEIRGLIEDRMSPRLNQYFCLDILCSREQMSELPFSGLAKLRIKK